MNIYAPNWPAISKRARRMTGGHCANCWIRKSTETHHMMYRDPFGPTAGREVPGWHVMPLCDRCHDCKRRRPGSAHHKAVWIYGRTQQDNHNTLGYRISLRAKFWGLWTLIRFWYVWALVFGLIALEFV